MNGKGKVKARKNGTLCSVLRTVARHKEDLHTIWIFSDYFYSLNTVFSFACAIRCEIVVQVRNHPSAFSKIDSFLSNWVGPIHLLFICTQFATNAISTTLVELIHFNFLNLTIISSILYRWRIHCIRKAISFNSLVNVNGEIKSNGVQLSASS